MVYAIELHPALLRYLHFQRSQVVASRSHGQMSPITGAYGVKSLQQPLMSPGIQVVAILGVTRTTYWPSLTSVCQRESTSHSAS